MDTGKIGEIIYNFRTEKKLTQKQLADAMHISDKTVSKWERGAGCPDVSLLPELCRFLGVNLEDMLSGELDKNDIVGGNMKKTVFYVCPECGNIISATAEANISCCGKKTRMLEPKKAEDEEKLKVEQEHLHIKIVLVATKEKLTSIDLCSGTRMRTRNNTKKAITCRIVDAIQNMD